VGRLGDYKSRGEHHGGAERGRRDEGLHQWTSNFPEKKISTSLHSKKKAIILNRESKGFICTKGGGRGGGKISISRKTRKLPHKTSTDERATRSQEKGFGHSRRCENPCLNFIDKKRWRKVEISRGNKRQSVLLKLPIIMSGSKPGPMMAGRCIKRRRGKKSPILRQLELGGSIVGKEKVLRRGRQRREQRPSDNRTF